MTLGTLFDRTYDAHSGSIAVISPDGSTLTWGDLGARARRMAGALRELGLAAGDRVVVCTKNRPEFVDIDHALFAGGFVRVGVRVHADHWQC